MICENASGPSTHIRRSTQCMGERRTQPGRLWDLWALLQHLRTEWRDSDGARDSMALKLRKSEYFGTWRGMECMVVASSLPPRSSHLTAFERVNTNTPREAVSERVSSSYTAFFRASQSEQSFSP